MLTRFVRIQLAIFTIASIIGALVMVIAYMQVPTLLGIGRITVKLELPASGGLYRFSNVTYRGVEVGKVTGMDVSREHATATLKLDTSPKIPADLVAEVRSVSAVGEQYVELMPRTDSPPYLQDGSVIAAADAKIPQTVGPMLDQVSTLINSVPKDKLRGLVDESFDAFNGAGYDLGSLFDSSVQISGDLNKVADQSSTLFEDTGPLLDSQAQTTDALRTWARSLAGITGQVVTNDPQVRTLLQQGPGAANEVSRLLDQVKPTLPVLLANLTTVGQVAVTYHPSLEQVLVLLPPFVGDVLSSAPENNPTGIPLGDFRIQIGDGPPCTVGFLPPSQWRSPAALDTPDTPDGLYCKLPQDSPIVVRGARNSPCMGVPGKRAPTVQECYSDKPYTPLAIRQHALGPYPIDPESDRAGHSAGRPGGSRRAALRPRGGHADAARRDAVGHPARCSAAGRTTSTASGQSAGATSGGGLPANGRRRCCARSAEFLRRQRIRARTIGCNCALRSADRPIRGTRWSGRPPGRSR